MSRWVLQIIRDDALHSIFPCVAQQPKLGPDRLFFSFLYQTQVDTHTHTRQDSSEQVISLSRRPLPGPLTQGKRCLQRNSNPRFEQSRGCRPQPEAPRPLGSPSKAFSPHCSWTLVTINTRVSLPMYRLLTPVLTFPKYLPHSFSVFVRHLYPVNRFPEVHPSPHPRKTGSCTNSVCGKQSCLPK